MTPTSCTSVGPSGVGCLWRTYEHPGRHYGYVDASPTLVVMEEWLTCPLCADHDGPCRACEGTRAVPLQQLPLYVRVNWTSRRATDVDTGSGGRT